MGDGRVKLDPAPALLTGPLLRIGQQAGAVPLSGGSRIDAEDAQGAITPEGDCALQLAGLLQDVGLGV